MTCCNHNCKQGRDCPRARGDGFSEWLDSVGRFITALAASCILGYLLGLAVTTLIEVRLP